jgi:arylsulfatase A-like enzyme
MGLLPRVSGEGEAGIRFIVEIVSETGRPEILFSTAVHPASPFAFDRLLERHTRVNPARDPWRRGTVDLSAWQGRTIRLRLRTEPSVPEGTGRVGPPHGFWGAPVLWTASRGRPVRDNFILLVTDSMRPEDASDPTGPWSRLRLEGVTFESVYTNALSPAWSFASLLSSRLVPDLGDVIVSSSPSVFQREEFHRRRVPSLVSELRREGYRTALIGSGSFLAEGSGDPVGLDWGFDEAHLFTRRGYEPVHVARRAVARLSRETGGPLFLLIYIRQPSDSFPPLRFWTSALSRLRPGRGFFTEWGYQSRLHYAAEYFGRVLDLIDARNLWQNSLVVAASGRGAEFRPRPVRVLPGAQAGKPVPGKAARRVIADGRLPLTESNLRTVWMMRHRTLPAGQSIPDKTQLLDLAPTALGVLGVARPSTFRGTAVDLSRYPRRYEPPNAPILVHGPAGRALLLDGHFKYIRRRAGRTFTAKGIRFVYPLHAEEAYDLWTDPEERRDIARSDRHLLARLRRAMDEIDPDPVETRLLFRGLDQPVRGSIVLPSGDLLAVDSSEGGNRRGLNQFDFELTQAAGEVNFRAWPPYSVFVLKLALGRASFPYERILVTRHGLPLLEGAESWFDHSDFPLLDGVPEAVPPADGPWLFLGRATVRNEARQKGTP